MLIRPSNASPVGTIKKVALFGWVWIKVRNTIFHLGTDVAAACFQCCADAASAKVTSTA
jgi:hypothetical protein